MPFNLERARQWEDKLQKIPKGSPNYKMGYRYVDVDSGREFTVKPFGYEGVKTKRKR